MVKPQTAAERVYKIPEIKKEILRFLAPKDLAAFMRVEKKGMFDVACELYREVKYNFVRLKMSLATPRQKLYCSAVSHVDATEMSLSPTMLRQLEIDKHIEAGPRRQERIAEWLRTYRIEVISLVVPQLRAKCSGLRSIRFGHPYVPGGLPSWVVRFDAPPLFHDHSSTPTSSSEKWLIDCTHTLYFRGDVKPRKTYPCPPAASPQYTVRSRFDLIFRAVDASLFEDWLNSLDTSSCYDDIHLHANFGNLPITLPLITSLYSRQSAAHHTERLSSIVASRLAQWQPTEFSAFAQTASYSLTSLVLARRHSDDRAAVSATDLPSFITSIRNHLPRLSSLHFALKDISHAEKVVCFPKLSASALAEYGSVTTLRIYTAMYIDPLFNVIRTLAPICDASADITIYRDDALPFVIAGFNKGQTRFLKYLRGQTPSRQQHLAIPDFSLLGVREYKEVYELEYREDGRPKTRGETLAAGWVEEVGNALKDMSEWESAVRSFAEAADHYRAMAANKTTREMGQKAEELLVLSDAVDESARRLRGYLFSTDGEVRRNRILGMIGGSKKGLAAPSPAREDASGSESGESELTELEE